jgi:hypothetical protein
MDPSFVLNHVRLAHLYPYLEKYDDAIDEETRARLLAGESPKSVLQKQEQ